MHQTQPSLHRFQARCASQIDFHTAVARPFLGEKSDREKKNARENSHFFGREKVFLGVKKIKNLPVKNNYAREKSEKNRKTRT